VIPTLDEEQSIAEVVRSIPRTIASRVIVADGGRCDATVARAKAAGVDGIDGRTKKSKSNGLSDVAATLSNSSSLVPPENHIRAYL
jgi:glycosyltransferase involved in cell wall biosynthesis